MTSTTRTPHVSPAISTRGLNKARPKEAATSSTGIGALRALAVMRIALGWVFLWAFLDKTFALGFATGRNEAGAVDYFGSSAWVNGGSPTEGFLSFGLNTVEPFSSLYSNLAGQAWVDWAFMLGMLSIGLALMLGFAIRTAAVAGIAMMTALYTASALLPANNPIVDDHVVYAIALGVIAFTGADRTWGLGNRWRSLEIVRDHAWMR